MMFLRLRFKSETRLVGGDRKYPAGAAITHEFSFIHSTLTEIQYVNYFPRLPI